MAGCHMSCALTQGSLGPELLATCMSVPRMAELRMWARSELLS